MYLDMLASGHPDGCPRAALRSRAPRGAQPRRRMDALPALGGGQTETMQKKVGRTDATPDLLLKHPNTTVATYI